MSLTIGVLSWKSHQTLRNTLQSYELWGLNELADQKLIWFQEISDEDKRIAKEFGYTPIGSDKNVGIADGYKGLVAEATGSLFLFLENDWVLIEDPETQITTGAVLLEARAVEVVRYRSRDFPGAPLWSAQFMGREMERPEYLLESLHWDEHPERHLSPMTGRPLITKLPYGWYKTTAPYAAWTNNPTMFETGFIKALSKDFENDIEIGMRGWWGTAQSIRVVQGDGLFTHNRIDR